MSEEKKEILIDGTDSAAEAENAHLNAEFSPDQSDRNPFKTRMPNKRPIVIVMGSALLLLGAFFYVTHFRSPPPESAAHAAGSTGGQAEGYEGLGHLKNGVVEKPATAPIISKKGFVEIKEAPPPLLQKDYTPPPAIVTSATQQPPVFSGNEDQLQQQIEQQRMQLLQEGARSSSSVSFTVNEPPQPPLKDNNAAYANSEMPTFNPVEHTALPDSERQKRWRIETEKKSQTSPYTLRTGFVIPAVLSVPMNSDTLGQTQAIVSQNVFDTASGRYLLIPQGTKLIGSYQSAPTYGTKRLAVLWERMIFPDGSDMDIGGMQGADFQGMNGLHDQVFSHWWRTLTSAFLMSLMQAPSAMGGALSMAGSSSGNSMMGNLSSGAGQAAQMSASQTGNSLSQVFSRDLNRSPTLIIRVGFPFNVMVNKDLVFKTPYAANDNGEISWETKKKNLK